jgi:hypothetical protein
MLNEDETPFVLPPILQEGRLGRARVWAALVRDIGVILGVPIVIGVGVALYDLQDKASQAQVKANEAQNKVLESQVKLMEHQNTALKDTQYDRALALLNSQKELFAKERESYDTQKRGDTCSVG